MRKLALIALLLSCSFISFSQNTPPINTIKQLTESIESLMKQYHITGLMLGITTKDSVIFSGGLGDADAATHRPVDSNTLFRMGSNTKMLVSLGILQLVREGKFQLTDELKKLVPEVPIVNQWEANHPVRVINLLEHTAGFDDMKLNRLYSADKIEAKGLECVLLQKNSLVCRWRPGERFAYSNPNYAILGYLIEKYSGKSYDEYLAGLILRPLGMTNTNFNITGKLPAQETREYYVKNGKTSEAPSVNLLIGPAGAMWSCSSDMLKFIRMFLNHGEGIFSDSIFQVMETPQTSLSAKAGLKTGYALGNLGSFFNAKFSYHGHDGLAGTCFSTCYYNREHGVGFVVATNSNIDPGPIRGLIVQYIEQHLVPDSTIAKPQTQPLDVAALKPWLGRYQFLSPRNEIGAVKDKLLGAPQIYVANNKLYLKGLISDGPYELEQTAPLTFGWKGNNAALIALTKNEEGKEVMMIVGSYFEKVSNTWAMTKRIAVVIVLLFAALSFVLAVVSLVGALLRKLKWKDAMVRILPFSAVAWLWLAVVQLLEVQQYSFRLYELASMGTRSLTVFAGSSLFTLFTFVTLYFALKNYRKTKKWFAVYYLLTALSLVVVLIAAWQSGWVGLRTWAM